MDLATATVVLVRMFLVVTMLVIGIRLADADLEPGTDRRRLVAALLGLNVLVVPLVGVGFAFGFGLGSAVAVAFVAVALAPAGSIAPKLAQIAGGDLRLAIAATFILSIVGAISLGPSLAAADGWLGLAPATGSLDLRSVVASLVVFQLTPTVVGWTIGRRSPSLAHRMARPLLLVSNALIILVVLVAVADTYDEVLGLGPIPVVAMLLFTLVSQAIGRAIGGGSAATRRAGMLVTAQRSPGLALLVVAGPGHALETATVTVFALVLLVVNGTAALWFGRGSITPAERRPYRSYVRAMLQER